jgi:hypothetical protein
MPRFPAQFTDATSVVSTDYLMVNGNRATAAQLAAATGGSPALEWDGAGVTQFDAVQSWGSPVTPTLTYVSSSTAASGVLRLRIGAASPALSGAVFWFTDTLAFQSMSIRYAVSVNAADPIQAADDLYVGVVVGGDATTGSCISHAIANDGAGTTNLLIGGNDGYGASAFSDVQSITPVVYSIVDWTFNGQLVNAAGFPALGVPAISGTTDIIATGASARQTFLDSITSASGWDVTVGSFDSDRVGLVVGTVGGCASAASLDISLLSISRNLRGYP